MPLGRRRSWTLGEQFHTPPPRVPAVILNATGPDNRIWRRRDGQPDARPDHRRHQVGQRPARRRAGPRSAPSAGRYSPGGHLRHRRRAFHPGAGLLRAGQVAFPAVPGSRVVRHRVRRRGRGRRGLGGNPGNRRHHARLRPLPQVRLRASSCVCRPERDRHHGMAGCPGREAPRPRRQPLPAPRRRRRPRGGPRRAGRQRFACRHGRSGGAGHAAAGLGTGQHRAAGGGLRARRGRGRRRGRPRLSPRRTGEELRRDPLLDDREPAVRNLRRRYRLQRRRHGPGACPAVRRARPGSCTSAFPGSPASSTPARSCSTTSRRWESSGRRPASRPQSSTTRTAGWTPGRSPRSSSASIARRRPSPARLIPAREPRSTSTRASNAPGTAPSMSQVWG